MIRRMCNLQTRHVPDVPRGFGGRRDGAATCRPQRTRMAHAPRAGGGKKAPPRAPAGPWPDLSGNAPPAPHGGSVHGARRRAGGPVRRGCGGSCMAHGRGRGERRGGRHAAELCSAAGACRDGALGRSLPAMARRLARHADPRAPAAPFLGALESWRGPPGSLLAAAESIVEGGAWPRGDASESGMRRRLRACARRLRARAAAPCGAPVRTGRAGSSGCTAGGDACRVGTASITLPHPRHLRGAGRAAAPDAGPGPAAWPALAGRRMS